MRISCHSPLALPVLLLSAAVGAQTNSRSLDLTESNFASVLASIQPKPSEVQWQQIAWNPDLGAALLEARAKDKPILLWAMNGNPCGMT
jgi:hypothetical protein